MAEQNANRDPIDEAIAGVEAADQVVTMVEVPVRMRPHGRPAVLHVPTDLTDVELIELTGWMLVRMRPYIAENFDGPRPTGLWVPPT